MSRKLPEWIADHDDQALPARVKVRIFERCKGMCVVCSLPIAGRLRPAYDHVTALCNGGANRESNIQVLCSECHKVKSRADVAEKATVYRKRTKHLGIAPKGRKIASRGFQKAAPQRTASRPIERRT